MSSQPEHNPAAPMYVFGLIYHIAMLYENNDNIHTLIHEARDKATIRQSGGT